MGMRRIHIYQNGQIATVEAERANPGVLTIPFQSTKDGTVFAPVEELDGGTLEKEDWDRLHHKKDMKVLKRVRKKCRVVYKRGIRPEIDKQRDSMFRQIAEQGKP